MQTAPIGPTSKSPQNTRQPVTRRTRRRLKPATIILGGILTVVVLGLMIATLILMSQGAWPPTSQSAPEASVHSTSPYASMLPIQPNGPVKKDPGSGQLTIPLKATNNLKVPPRASGTPVPHTTPIPVAAKVLAATVKVLCYSTPNGQRTFQGEAYGGFSNPQGLAPGATQNFDVQASGIGNCDSFDAFADLISTDQDPVGTATAGPTKVVSGGGTVVPVATSSVTPNP